MFRSYVKGLFLNQHVGRSYQPRLLLLDPFVSHAHDLGTIFIFNLLHQRISKKSRSSSLQFPFQQLQGTGVWEKCGKKEGIVYIDLG